ncbi:hypothetical protein MPLSOD_50185 [Mesorhizobium sp. SOD10]|nr:hypothetical protein MPLSOD_50185 [Mesorhizobium sp. SOD10]
MARSQACDSFNICCQIRARQIGFFGGIALSMSRDFDRFDPPLRGKKMTLAVETVAETILDTNRRAPRSSFPDLIAGR